MKIPRDSEVEGLYKLAISKLWNYYWFNIHWFAINYPDNPTPSQKKQVIGLVECMKKDGIGCPECTKHFNDYTRRNPIEYSVDCKTDLFIWWYDLHNAVNTRNGKSVFSYDKAVDMFSSKGWNEELSKFSKPMLAYFEEGNLPGFCREFTGSFEKFKKAFCKSDE